MMSVHKGGDHCFVRLLLRNELLNKSENIHIHKMHDIYEDYAYETLHSLDLLLSCDEFFGDYLGSSCNAAAISWLRASTSRLCAETSASISFLPVGSLKLNLLTIRTFLAFLSKMIQRFCGGRTRFELLTSENPKMSLSEKK